MAIHSDYLLEQLSPYDSVKRWWLGFSGGLDSQVLLDLALSAGLHKSHDLKILHVHHGLQDEADSWVEDCRKRCQDLGVPLTVSRVQVSQGASPEAMAREARYQVFDTVVAEGDGLLLAHHQDDQAETMLLRLLRGSGPKGLSGIPQHRSLAKGALVRPLLGLSRQQLEAHAQQQRLQWIEDPSNQSLQHDRNYLRHQVLPQLKQRWPHALDAFSRTARFCHEADQLNQQLAAMDYQQCGVSGRLQCPQLLALAPERQRNLIRYWLRESSLLLPEERVMEQILSQLLNARPDAEPCVSWGDVQMRRFQQQLYLVDGRWQPPLKKCSWDLRQPLCFSFGELSVQPACGEGVKIPAGSRVEVGFRQGGEKLRLHGREGSRSLKKLLQEAQVPPWRRPLLPLIYVDGELAAVADLWISEDYQAVQAVNEEALIKFVWDAFFLRES
ncbi:MAG: tRNA lysidine(34) synthetase TilS [Motiliproteus sp.]